MLEAILCRQEKSLTKQTKFYNKENRDRIKEYQLKNHDKIRARKRICSINKCKSDKNFRLICRTRSRIRHVLRGKFKSCSTKDILGIDINLYKKWRKFQFTPEMTCDNIEIDQPKAICMFDISKEEELKEEASSWKTTQPLLKHDHRQKGIKFRFLDYQLQITKGNQFLKLNERGYN